LESLNGRDHSEDLGIDDDNKTDLKEGRLWTGLIRLIVGIVVDSCEYNKEPSVSVTGWEFLH
jgi:hypothetical protein